MLNNPAKSYFKFKTQRVIAIASLLIFIGKITAYLITSSVGILTDALESTVNVATGFISLYAVYISLKPKDSNHPFGHGKAEFLSASIEGFLILAASAVIMFEAVRRLFSPTVIKQLDVGIVIVAVAGLINYIIGWYSKKIGRQHNSVALVSGGRHLQSDTYSSIGLVVGLVLLYFTGWQWLDSLIAIVFGLIILVTGFRILSETTSNLMDKADMKLIERFGRLINENKKPQWIDIHNFKLVKYGDVFHINCDLVLPFDTSLADAHREGEELKAVMTANFSEDIVCNLHIDECFESYCKHCRKADCRLRREPFVEQLDFDIDIFVKEKAETPPNQTS